MALELTDDAPASGRSLLLETLRALTERRVSGPLALVLLALLSAEWFASHSLPALALDLLLYGVFCLCAPALWRGLFSGPPAGLAARVAGALLYVAANVTLVGLVTVALPPSLGLPWTYVVDPHGFGVLVVLFLVGGWGLGRDIELERGVAREKARAERALAEAERAQLLALRAQLDPHFLFNTLNAIAEWCREDARVAERATLDLARILRGIFDAVREPRWSLAREVALLEQLAGLYAARDAERYRFRFEVDAALAARAEVPPLLLLPLFENALKHGPAAGHEGEVSLLLRAEGEDAVRVEVTNPGPFRGPREGGHGVPMVERRLALAYGARASLALGGGASPSATRATVLFPCTLPSEPRG